MKFSSAAFVLAAAGSAVAHPGAPAVEARDFVVTKKPWFPAKQADPSTPYQTPPADPPAPYQAVPAAPAAPAPALPALPAGPKPGGSVPKFCDAAPAAKRATLAQIASIGNVGAPGSYGCNMMTVPEEIVDKYHYSITFTNNRDQDQACACWDKIGRDGGINGCFKGNEAVQFVLPAGGKQAVVFDSNSQGACDCNVGASVLTPQGQHAGTWLEFDFGSRDNGGWSGADASCLVPAAYSIPVHALQVCNGDQCSTIHEGGTGDNAYVAGTEAADGIGLNIPPGDVHLTALVG